MSDLRLEPRSALEGLIVAGRSGRLDGEAGVVLCERTDVDLCLILASKRPGVEWREALRARGFELPGTARRTLASDLALMWIGPDQWLGVGSPDRIGEVRDLLAPFEPACSVVQAGDARVTLTVSGPRARETLAKLVPIDLHPRTFPADAVAVTVAGATPVIVWRRDGASGYGLAVPRSYAASFWHWLVDSASEYGCLVDEDPAQP